jgi:hypothetical protein
MIFLGHGLAPLQQVGVEALDGSYTPASAIFVWVSGIASSLDFEDNTPMKAIIAAMAFVFFVGTTGFVCLLVFYHGDHVETLAGQIIVGMTSLLGILGALLRVESKLQENTDLTTKVSRDITTAAVTAQNVAEKVDTLQDTVLKAGHA